MRGGVLTGEQQGEDVAHDFVVAEGALGFLGGDHALEEVLRLLAQLRSRGDPLPRLLHEPRNRLLDLLHRAVERAVGGQFEVTPIREREEEAPVGHVEDVVQVALQAVVAALERVEVVAEGERRGDVDREGGERLADLEALAGLGRPRGACREALGAGADDLEVAL